jgi:hypothetical protein
MRTCPRCERVDASERRRCLYCGSELPELAGATARCAAPVPADDPGAAGSTTMEPGAARCYLVLDASRVDPQALAVALQLSAYEAAQRVRRGGLQLLRVANEDEAAREASRLGALGLSVERLPEAEVRRAEEPLVLSSGRFEQDALRAEAASTALRVARGELLLVVRGPIRRELGPGIDWRKRRSHVPREGYRFHLHRLQDPRPIEIDPEGFEFPETSGEPGSSLLRLLAWIDALAADAPVDDAFRSLAPALAPATESPAAGLAAARALRREDRQRGKDEAPTLLDNLRQFRAYSAWRGAAERRSRASHAPRHP